MIIPLNDLDPMPFGPYRGTILMHVPSQHLVSLRSSPLLKNFPDLEAYLNIAWSALQKEEQARISGEAEDEDEI